MIILDTNVLSETQKASPDERVMTFLDRLDPSQTFITSITVAEMLFGIDILPDGKRKRELEDSAFDLFNRVFKGRVLPFDFDAASRYAIMAADARKLGHTVSLADGMIAGIARAKSGARVATRDTAPFKALHVSVINPWEEQPRRWRFHPGEGADQ